MGCICGNSKIDGTFAPPDTTNEAEVKADEPQQTMALEFKAGNFVQLLKEPIYRQYTVTRQLGAGSFANGCLTAVLIGKIIGSIPNDRKYCELQQATHQKRAIKEVEKTLVDVKSASKSQFITEVEILSKLDHPNIFKVYELFEDPQRYYMVTEVCEGGELFDHLIKSGRLTEDIVVHIMYQLFSAVCFCHTKGIVHRDLKPENLLIDSFGKNGEVNIKVIDFGTSCLLETGGKLTKRVGTPYYVAPEVLRNDYNEKCDIWSSGVILYILLSGQPPFEGRHNIEIIAAIQEGTVVFKDAIWTSISDDAKSFIRRLLESDYNRRPSARDCLRDPWLQRYHAKTLSDSAPNLNSLDNLKGFYMETQLKQAFTSYIVAQVLSKEQTKQLSTEFSALDKDGDGRLSREELMEAYSRHMPEEQALEIVNHVMSSADTDGSGFIEYSEFIAAATNRDTLLSKQNLQQAFNACDKDHSGSISVAELKQMLGGANVGNEHVWNRMIEEADRNGDGEIDLKEFMGIMLQAEDL